jgi:hypothetical protein
VFSPDPHGCCLNGPGGVPSDFDAVSVDMYAGTLGLDGLPDPNSTCPEPTREAHCVFDYLRKSVYPHLRPSQKVFVVPGTYGSVGCFTESTVFGPQQICTGGAAAQAATDHILTAKFNLYWELAVKDPTVIGEHRI